MKNENLKIKLENLTKESGVYKMIDKSGKVIYVGKAKNLKNRVSNYFVKSNQDEKTQLLQKNIDDFSIIITKTETQALLLENDLIKQFKPSSTFFLRTQRATPIFILVMTSILGWGCLEARKIKTITILAHTHLSMQQEMH